MIATASQEVRSGIVYATMIIVLVFVPLFALPGHRGAAVRAAGHRLHRVDPGSLLTSITVTPVLSYYLLSGRVARRRSATASSSGTSSAGTARCCSWAFDHRAACDRRRSRSRSWSRRLCRDLAAAQLPAAVQRRHARSSSLQYNPGISLAESHRLGLIAERLIAQVPEVKSVGRRTGRAELDEHAEGVHYSEIDVDLARSEPLEERKSTPTSASAFRCCRSSVAIGQPISHRLDHMQSGVRAQIVLKIFGEDLDTLRQPRRDRAPAAGGSARAWSTSRSRSRC